MCFSVLFQSIVSADSWATALSSAIIDLYLLQLCVVDSELDRKQHKALDGWLLQVTKEKKTTQACDCDSLSLTQSAAAGTSYTY